jgi:LuxR family maltose regulon positive regulatory protein
MATAESRPAEGATERIASAEAIVVGTKLNRPTVRSEHVPRGRLLAALREGAACKLTLIAAPPGFGKTTLLAEWAAAEAERDAGVAWLSLDENDNDPARFFTYVVAALQRADPGIVSHAVAALGSPGADLLGVVLPAFVNDLAELPRPVALVIEDYHLITDEDVHRLFAYLIDRSPQTLRIVLSTRQDPPFPLGRLRARGELAEVRADDLRFGDDEAAAFLVDGLHLPLTTADLDRLQAQTEGWPAALYLAALSLRGRSDASRLIERFSGDDRYVVDYLTTEVLARQPPELRKFLLRTSVLKRLSGSLCDAVAGLEGSAARLADLERSNLFLVPLDTTRDWYRYHHLFGDLLRHELEATERAEVPLLHRRASAWYRQASLIVEAADHAIAGGDIEAAAELVGRHYASFVDQGQIATVIRWLEAMPEESVAGDWLLAFAGAVVYAHDGRFEEAERLLRLAERAPQVPRNGQDPGGPVAALAGYLRLLRGDIGGTVENGRRALASAAGTDPAWALGPQMVLAPGLWWAGEPGEARRVLEAVARTGRSAGIPAATVYALGILAAIALDEQDDRTAEALATEAIGLVHESGLEDHPWAAMAHIVHGTIKGHANQLPLATEEIERGLALGERLGAWQLIVYASLALAEVRQRQHDSPSARRLLGRVRDILSSLPDPGDGFTRLERTEKSLKLRAPRDRVSTAAPFWELSQREMEVLRYLPSRLSQREIAAELYVSFNTVRTHTRVIFSKLGVTSRAEAVARARELGLL